MRSSHQHDSIAASPKKWQNEQSNYIKSLRVRFRGEPHSPDHVRFLSENPSDAGTPSGIQVYRSKSTSSYHRLPSSSHGDSLGFFPADIAPSGLQKPNASSHNSPKSQRQDQPMHLPVSKDSLMALDRDMSMGLSTLESFTNGGLEAYDTIDSKSLQLPPLVLQPRSPAPSVAEVLPGVAEVLPAVAEVLPAATEMGTGAGEVVSESEEDTYNIYSTEKLIAESSVEAAAPLKLHCVYEEQEKNEELIARILAEQPDMTSIQPDATMTSIQPDATMTSIQPDATMTSIQPDATMTSIQPNETPTPAEVHYAPAEAEPAVSRMPAVPMGCEGFTQLAAPSFLDTSPNTSSLLQQESSGLDPKGAAPINDRISPDVPDAADAADAADAPDVLDAVDAMAEVRAMKAEREEWANEGSPVFHDVGYWRTSASYQRDSVEVSSVSPFTRSSYESLEDRSRQLRNGAMTADKYDFSADDQSDTKMESYARPSFLQEDDMDLADWRNHPSRFPSYNGKEDGD